MRTIGSYYYFDVSGSGKIEKKYGSWDIILVGNKQMPDEFKWDEKYEDDIGRDVLVTLKKVGINRYNGSTSDGSYSYIGVLVSLGDGDYELFLEYNGCSEGFMRFKYNID